MSNVELLFSMVGVLLTLIAGIIIPLSFRFGNWMSTTTRTLADIRVHQGRHDGRLERVETDVKEVSATLQRHDGRLLSLEHTE